MFQKRSFAFILSLSLSLFFNPIYEYVETVNATSAKRVT